MLNLDELAIFVKIAELQNFTQAAKALGLPKATLSRRFSEFEKRINKQLLTRSTRRVTLTPDGEELFTYSQSIINQSLDLQRLLEGKNDWTNGKIKLSTSQECLDYLISPYIKEFIDEYQEVTFDIDVVSPNSDKSFYDSDIVVGLPLSTSDNYATHGVSYTRQWLVSTLQVANKVDEVFEKTKNEQEIEETEKVRYLCQSTQRSMLNEHPMNPCLIPNMIVNDVRLIKQLTLEGHGVALLNDYVIQSELKTNQLVCLHPEYPLPEEEVLFAYPKNRAISAASKHFVKFLMSKIPKRHRIKVTSR